VLAIDRSGRPDERYQQPPGDKVMQVENDYDKDVYNGDLGGRSNGTIRADEDELCALYLRARLEGRQPDVAAIRAVLATMPPSPNPKLVAAGAYDPKDREIAAEVDAIAFAISVRREAGLLIAEAERNDLQPSTGFLILRNVRLPAPVAGCRPRSFERELSKRPICHSRGRAYRIE
jgi:exodeoxyribonuclease V alpha subunit